MRDIFRLLAVAAVVTSLAMVSGCGKKTGETGSESGVVPLPSAATLGDQIVLTAEEYLESEPFVGANRKRGEQQAQICRACHSLDNSGRNMIGPALYGFFGTEVGTRSGLEYSAVLRNADFVWTPEALNARLAQPGRFLPGNRMTFAGVLRQEDRNDLIAYLLEVTTATDSE